MVDRRYVTVRGDMPPGHVRTPAYLRGKTGWIERELGEFPNPEALAYGLDAEKRPLLRVRFMMDHVWGATDAQSQDTIDAEIFAHWLEPADPPCAT